TRSSRARPPRGQGRRCGRARRAASPRRRSVRTRPRTSAPSRDRDIPPCPRGRASARRGRPGRAHRLGDDGPVSLYRDEGIVLRTQKLGEADRIVTLLTRHHGKVRAVAKGVRRTSSRFGSRLEPFMAVDLQLHSGRNLDIVTQAETLAPYGRRIGTDYALYTTG